MYEEITVTQLADKIAAGADNYQLVDVREPQELAIVSLPGFIHLPLSESARWTAEIDTILDRDLEIFVLCHHGVRSAQMCQWLNSRGFIHATNIIGGIDAYSHLVDPSLPRY
jgi:rhodanese-related sulfurtransferase